MPGIGDQRRGVDAPAHDELVPGDDLVPGDAQRRAGDAQDNVAGGAVVDEFADALVPRRTPRGPRGPPRSRSRPGPRPGPGRRGTARSALSVTAGSTGTPRRWSTRR